MRTGKYNSTIFLTLAAVMSGLAGGALLVSDKLESYKDDRNLEGMKRNAPVLFTVPGQLYDRGRNEQPVAIEPTMNIKAKHPCGWLAGLAVMPASLAPADPNQVSTLPRQLCVMNLIP